MASTGIRGPRDRAAPAPGDGLRSRMRRDLTTAGAMIGEAGLWATLRHGAIVTKVRIHNLLIDRRVHGRLPRWLPHPVPIGGLSVRASAKDETEGVPASSAIPSRTLTWAVEGLGIDARRYCFVDVGSGHGSALVVAASWPFRRVVGMEFARELHEAATENVAWARANLALAAAIELRHESVLVAELPREPLVLFLFNPFGSAVMDRFLDPVEDSSRVDPRDIVLIYANPEHRDCLRRRPAFQALALRRRQTALIKAFSPFQVLAYRYTGQQPGVRS